jgi:predicted transcriptional regulator
MSVMNRRFDIGEFVDTETEQSVLLGLIKREKQRRKELHLTQKELSVMSGVSYASVRRFEVTGDISLSSLLKIGSAMDCLLDFNELFKNKKITDLKDYNV